LINVKGSTWQLHINFVGFDVHYPFAKNYSCSFSNCLSFDKLSNTSIDFLKASLFISQKHYFLDCTTRHCLAVYCHFNPADCGNGSWLYRQWNLVCCFCKCQLHGCLQGRIVRAFTENVRSMALNIFSNTLKRTECLSSAFPWLYFLCSNKTLHYARCCHWLNNSCGYAPHRCQRVFAGFHWNMNK